jgi:3'-phosphoadenosine 5'-phosphosulfate sulfotransferase (PAPS reductase)/FAD synthetase
MSSLAPAASLPRGAFLSPERIYRLNLKLAESREIMSQAREEACAGYDVRGTVLLFSGGNDSTTLVHLFRDQATHAFHANTGIGIEETRVFVRDMASTWNLPLIENHTRPGRGYDELVLGQVPDLRRPGQMIKFKGFPGPGSHSTMFAFLKERAIDALKVRLCQMPRRQRVILIGGRRRAESKRRQKIKYLDVKGSAVFVSPLVNWTNEDLNTYRALNDVPRNEVSDLLHMSGECLCGAFAHSGELEEIGDYFPYAADRIRGLERRALDSAVAEPSRCKWGWGAGRERPSGAGPLCSSCEFRYQPSLDDMTAAELGGAAA